MVVLGSTPVGVYHLVVTAQDTAAGEIDSQQFTLTVQAAPTATTPPPVAGSTTLGSCATLNAAQAAQTSFKRSERFFVQGVLPGVRTVNVFLDEIALIGSGTTDDGGLYLVTATVPSIASLGAHTIVVRGTSTQAVRATCGIDVVAAGAAVRTTRRLPTTGSPILPVGLMGLLFLGTGAGMLLYYRRQAWAVLSAVWTEADVFFVREENRFKALLSGLRRRIKR
jgi:hypothetical protein